MSKYSSISLTKQLELSVSIAIVQNELASYTEGKFEIKKIGQQQYKFVSNSSIGTMIIKGRGPIEGIKIFALVSSQNTHSVKVTLKTKLRIEIVIIATIMFFVIIFSLITRQSQIIWAVTVFPIVLLWFWFIYRIQELKLISKVEKYLAAIQLVQSGSEIL